MSLFKDDGHSIISHSRATSVSRKSTLSRNQSLIKKNTAPSDLRPSDILIERFVAWKAITKQLIAYFEGIADIENNTAKELTKLGAVIQVPFRAGNQFLGEGGLQDIFYSIRDRTRTIADHHANLGKTIDSSLVQHLQKLRAEIKAHIRNIQNDTGKLATNVAKERELSTKNIADLARSIAMFKNTPMAVSPKDDPYCQNLLVMKQLQKQVNEENALQKSIIIMQQNSAHFEEGIVKSIQSAWQTFDEWQSRMSSSVQETWKVLGQHMSSLAPDREWIAFAARSDHLLDPDTPLRNPQTIEYPSKDDPSVIPLHVGMLERKRRFTRSYKEAYFVLTAAGYLHQYVSSDPTHQNFPEFSLFLPSCTLGPPSPTTSKSHKFHIEGKKDSNGLSKSGSILGGSAHAYTFRARSHDEMLEWWNDVRMLVARYLVASEQMERSGPIAAAVRQAGYVSEEEEEEEEGSSFEEEPEDEDAKYVANNRGRVSQDEEVPAYSQPSHDSGIRLGEHGYAMEKKEYAYTNGTSVSRKISVRRQEKAPEGRPPRPIQGEDEDNEDEGSVVPGGYVTVSKPATSKKVSPSHTPPEPRPRTVTPPPAVTPRVSVWSEPGPAPTEIDIDEVEHVPSASSVAGHSAQGDKQGNGSHKRSLSIVEPVKSDRGSIRTASEAGSASASPKGRHGVLSKFKGILH